MRADHAGARSVRPLDTADPQRRPRSVPVEGGSERRPQHEVGLTLHCAVHHQLFMRSPDAVLRPYVTRTETRTALDICVDGGDGYVDEVIGFGGFRLVRGRDRSDFAGELDPGLVPRLFGEEEVESLVAQTLPACGS